MIDVLAVAATPPAQTELAQTLKSRHVAALAQLYLRKDIFTLLVSASRSVHLFALLIVAVAQIRERQRLEKQGIQLKFKVWLFPWLSYAVLAGMVGVFVVLAFIPAAQIELVMSGLAVCVVLVAAVLRQRHLRFIAAAA